MKQLRILFIIVSLLCGLPMMGQTKEKTLEYGGWVEEFVTHTAITNAKLTLLDDKGEVVKETISDERNEQKNGGFTFIVANNHRYTIKVECDGYVPQSFSFDVKVSKRVNTRYLPTIFCVRRKSWMMSSY